MKKNDCIHCANKTCGDCSKLFEKSNEVNINPDLYAAEFLLYAFHFQQEIEEKKSNAGTRTIPLMMLASEG
jgi:hypothetical protein